MDRSLYFFRRLYGESMGRKAQKYALVDPARLPRKLVWQLHLYRVTLAVMPVLLIVFSAFTCWTTFFIALIGIFVGWLAKSAQEEALDRALDRYLHERER
jgi:hypothetical protein